MLSLKNSLSQLRTRDWIELILGAAFIAWQAVTRLIGWLGDIDFIISRIQDPDWLGIAVAWALDPPGWTLWPALPLGFLLLWVSLRHASAPGGRIESGAPEPTAEIERDGYETYIRITNNGAVADFSGKLTILDSSAFVLLEDYSLAGKRYDAYWKEASGGTSRIHNSHHDRIALSTRTFNEAGSVEFLALPYWDRPERKRALINAIPISMFSPPEGEEEHALVVELHLATEPELARPWKKIYRITPTTVTEEEEPAEVVEPGYTVGKWADHDNYECNHCMYATLDEEKMKEHMRWKHKRGQA